MADQAFIVRNVRGDMKKILPAIFSLFLLSSCISSNLTHIEPVTKPSPKIENLTAKDFVKGSEDIPLLSNLELIENDGVNFDSDSGSFVTVDYESPIALESVQGFYLRTLPEMGWRLIKNNAAESNFTRDNEKIRIEFLHNDEEKERIVRFSMSSVVRK